MTTQNWKTETGIKVESFETPSGNSLQIRITHKDGSVQYATVEYEV